MSSASFTVTVLRRQGPEVSLRCRSWHDAEEVAATRSFVALMLGVVPDLVDGGAPPKMVQACTQSALGFPSDEGEARRMFAPVLDTMIESTEIASVSPAPELPQEELVSRIADEIGDPKLTWEELHNTERFTPTQREDLLCTFSAHYVLDARFVRDELIDGLEVGSVFNTTASDAWWEDPENPLVSEEERTQWQDEVTLFLAEADVEETRITQIREKVLAWMQEAEAAEAIQTNPDGRNRLAAALTHIVQRARSPRRASKDLMKLLFENEDVEEIYADDRVLRASLERLVEMI